MQSFKSKKEKDKYLMSLSDKDSKKYEKRQDKKDFTVRNVRNGLLAGDKKTIERVMKIAAKGDYKAQGLLRSTGVIKKNESITSNGKVKAHRRSVKGKGNTGVRTHSRKKK